MSEVKYVINGCYCFDVIADGARPSSCDSVSISLKLEHDEAMDIGETFIDSEPGEMDADYNFGIKDKLDESILKSIVRGLKTEWEEERENYLTEKEEEYQTYVDAYMCGDYDEELDEEESEDDDEEGLLDEEDYEYECYNEYYEEEPDFDSIAYEQMGELFYIWDDNFIRDCVDYYRQHMDEVFS